MTVQSIRAQDSSKYTPTPPSLSLCLAVSVSQASYGSRLQLVPQLHVSLIGLASCRAGHDLRASRGGAARLSHAWRYRG